jgi:hypothetical protein
MKKHALMILLQLAASGADSYLTNRNMHQNNPHEANPIARPFVRHEFPLAGYFAATAAGHVLAAEQLRAHQHSRLAALAEVEGLVDNAGCAFYSARHGK